MSSVICFHQIPNGNIIIDGLYSITAYQGFIAPIKRRYGEIKLIGIIEYTQNRADWNVKQDLKAYKVIRVTNGRRVSTAEFYADAHVLRYIKDRAIDVRVPEPKPHNPGVVYFAKASKGIKIGFSCYFEDRRRALKYKYRDIEFVGFMAGTIDTEDSLHKQFREYMITKAKTGNPNVDWFVPCQAIEDFIKSNAVPDLESVKT